MSDKTVISFERSAEDWLRYAKRAHKQKRYPDAIGFCRKAFEQGPGSAALYKTAAQIYADMQCPFLSNEFLYAAMKRFGPDSDMLYLAGNNALLMSDENLAQRAFESCILTDPAGLHADTAQDMLTYYPWRDASICTPRSARAAALCRRAMSSRPRREKLELLRKAVRLDKGSRSCILLSYALMHDRPKAAFAFWKKACGKKIDAPLRFFHRTIGAYLFGAFRRKEQMLICLKQAARSCGNLDDLEQFVSLALFLGETKIAKQCLHEKKKSMPLSAECLQLERMCALFDDDVNGAVRLTEQLENMTIRAADVHPRNGLFSWRSRRTEVLRAIMDLIPPDTPSRGGIRTALTHKMMIRLSPVLKPQDISRTTAALFNALPASVQKHIAEDSAPEWEEAFYEHLCDMLRVSPEEGLKQVFSRRLAEDSFLYRIAAGHRKAPVRRKRVSRNRFRLGAPNMLYLIKK